MAELTAYEQMIFKWVNGQASHTWLDPLMQLLSSELVWLLLGCGAVAWLLIRGHTYTRQACVCALLVLAICDSVSYRILKPHFDRQRPCYQEADVRLVADGCGSKQGFPSNHATNSMAVATLIYLFCRGRRQRLRVLAPFALAGVVGYSRMYVGVHYPFDVLMGFALGSLIAVMAFNLFRWLVGDPPAPS